MAPDRTASSWCSLRCCTSLDLHDTLLLRTATAVLAKHSLRISTFGDSRWHDRRGDDALDRGSEHEGQLHCVANWNWARAFERSASLVGVSMSPVELDPHHTVLCAARLGTWRLEYFSVLLWQDW
jgi:hypothetical protein